MASILQSVADCCSQCCEVNIVDLPSVGEGGAGFSYDTKPIFRQESRVTVLVEGMPATLYGGVTRGDGQGGLYYFDSTSVLADDDVSVIKPDSVAVGAAGRWMKWL